MGTFYERIEIMNSVRRGRKVSLDALVDTGAAYTVVPRKVLRRLGVRPRRKGRFKLADGRVIERAIGMVTARVKGQETPTWAVFGDDGAEALLGALTLEELGLGVDNLHRTLVTITTYPLYPSPRHKSP